MKKLLEHSSPIARRFGRSVVGTRNKRHGVAKKLLACAAIAGAGCACAQSSAVIFGLIDVGVKYGTASGPGSASRLSLGSGNTLPSRLGFRVDEDLGGGLHAGAWLEGSVIVDSGRGGVESTNNQKSGLVSSGGFMFDRRATVSLADPRWGEVRAGRDFTPQNFNVANDPFLGSGVGMPLTQPFTAGPAAGLVAGDFSTAIRASNTISYFLPPKLGGMFGQFQYYMGENARNGAASAHDGDGAAVRLGYEAGPVKAAVATSITKYATGDAHQTNAAVNWYATPVQLSAHIARDRLGSATGRGWMVGALFPVNTLELKASYSRYDIANGTANPRAAKLALGVQDNLSKRTILYATWATVHNSNGSAITLNAAVAGGPNQNSSGIDVGIRHIF